MGTMRMTGQITIGWQKFVYDERDTTKLQFRNTEILDHVSLIEQ